MDRTDGPFADGATQPILVADQPPYDKAWEIHKTEHLEKP